MKILLMSHLLVMAKVSRHIVLFYQHAVHTFVNCSRFLFIFYIKNNINSCNCLLDFYIFTFYHNKKSTPCKHPVIVLQDVAFSDLHALVEFIYHGEVNVHQRSLSSFLKTAEVLRVSGLTQQADSSDRDEVR